MKFTVKELLQIALLLAVTIIIHLMEAIFVIPIGGFHLKIGVSNIVILLALFRMNIWLVLFFTLCKCFFSFIYEPSFTSLTFFISLSGSLLSLASMLLMKVRFKSTIVPVSIVGGVFHNLGQLLVIYIFAPILQLVYWLPLLVIAGMVAGYLTGKITQWVLHKIEKSILFTNQV